MRPLLILLLITTSTLALTSVIADRIADFDAIVLPLLATTIVTALVIATAFSRLLEKVRGARMRVVRKSPQPVLRTAA